MEHRLHQPMEFQASWTSEAGRWATTVNVDASTGRTLLLQSRLDVPDVAVVVWEERMLLSYHYVVFTIDAMSSKWDEQGWCGVTELTSGPWEACSMVVWMQRDAAEDISKNSANIGKTTSLWPASRCHQTRHGVDERQYIFCQAGLSVNFWFVISILTSIVLS